MNLPGVDLIQWLYVAIVAPVFGWLAGAFGRWRLDRRGVRNRVRFLSGLPMECKALLIEFNLEGTHTMRIDPLDPACRLMATQKILLVGPGGGTYDAVDSYVTVAPEWWEVMDAWTRRDKIAKAIWKPMVQRRLRELDEAQAKGSDH